MTTQRDFDRDFRIYLDEQAVGRAPDGLLEAALAGVESTRQRPRLLVADRWRPRRLVSRASLGPRVVAVVTVVLLLIALATVLAMIGSSRRPAPPFGLAKPGLIAFDANGDLFASNPDGSGLVQLTSGPEFEALPAYSPDGTLIAFESQQPDFSYDVFVMPADGGARVRVIEGLAETGPIAWSPDSRHVAVAARPVGEDGRCRSSSARSTTLARCGSAGRTCSGAIRPGRRTAVESPSTGRPVAADRSDSLWVIDVDGSNAHEVAPNIGTHGYGHVLPHEVEPDSGGAQPTWSADGRRLAFLAPGVGDLRDVYVVDADGRNLRNVSNSPEEENGVAWSPDGTRLAYVRNRRPVQQQRVLPGRRCRRLERAPRPRPPVEPGPPDLVARWRPPARHGVRGSETKGSMPTRTPSSSSTHPGSSPPVTTRISNFGTASYQRLAP